MGGGADLPISRNRYDKNSPKQSANAANIMYLDVAETDPCNIITLHYIWRLF